MARLRAVVVVAVVLVLGAWTCQVPTDSGQVSPGSPGATVASGVTTTGLTTLLSGEDWHYVGEAGEPAFSTGWSNASSSYAAMAFRLRAGGVVDLVGYVATDGTGPSVFTLPAGYRPTTGTSGMMPYIRLSGGTRAGRLLVVNDNGFVLPTDGDSAGDSNYISGSFFIVPPHNAP